MIIIKNEKEIALLREGGKRLGAILNKLKNEVRPGISAKELDIMAENMIRAGGDEPAFLHYKPEGAPRPYPASLCVSINNNIVHGIPTENDILKTGDIVSLDLGLKHKGLFTDSAITVAVGKIPKAAQHLLDATEQSLEEGIRQARAGNTVGDIGYVIESYITPHKYGIVRELAGHGVGIKIHEDPYVPNYGKKGKGEVLKAGMVIAIEPMINEGGRAVVFEDDGYTVRTKDGSRSAHFEHTILITDGEPEVLTRR